MLKTEQEVIDGITSAMESVVEWYNENYPTDDVLRNSESAITFIELVYGMYNGEDFYTMVGGDADSIVRERVFNRLAEIFKTSYTAISKIWLEYGA